MTERKPPGMPFESWIDQQVREATERGEFDDLPGKGKPIPHGAADEDWWLRNYLQREGLRADGLLPESIVLRREREDLLKSLPDIPTEREVRATVSNLNARIVEWLRFPSGPQVPIAPLQVEEVVETWRGQRTMVRANRTPVEAETPPQAATHRPWWRRLFS